MSSGGRGSTRKREVLETQSNLTLRDLAPSQVLSQGAQQQRDGARDIQPTMHEDEDDATAPAATS